MKIEYDYPPEKSQFTRDKIIDRFLENTVISVGCFAGAIATNSNVLLSLSVAYGIETASDVLTIGIDNLPNSRTENIANVKLTIDVLRSMACVAIFAINPYSDVATTAMMLGMVYGFESLADILNLIVERSPKEISTEMVVITTLPAWRCLIPRSPMVDHTSKTIAS